MDIAVAAITGEAGGWASAAAPWRTSATHASNPITRRRRERWSWCKKVIMARLP